MKRMLKIVFNTSKRAHHTIVTLPQRFTDFLHGEAP